MLNFIIEEQVNYKEVKFYLDGKWIRKGQNPWGDILYNIDGKWIRKGQSPYGDIVCTIH